MLGVATHLKTVLPRTPANEWLGPMTEAPSVEGASLVSETPPSGSHRGGVLRGYGDRQPERQDIQGHRFTMVVAFPIRRLG